MRKRSGPPSWLGTVIVVVAVAAMLAKAALELRASVRPASSAPTPASSSSAR